ncbi:MAG: FxsA family protein [Acidimicrobiales bacterium]
MFSPLAITMVLLAFAEYQVFRWLSGTVGVGSALLVTIAVSLLAALVGWVRVKLFLADSLKDVVTGSLDGTDGRSVAADRTVRILAFFLCVVPGLVSGALGFALLVPPVRRRVAARLAPRFVAASSLSFGSFGPFGGAGFGTARPDVIDTDVVGSDARSSTRPQNPQPSARPELG